MGHKNIVLNLSVFFSAGTTHRILPFHPPTVLCNLFSIHRSLGNFLAKLKVRQKKKTLHFFILLLLYLPTHINTNVSMNITQWLLVSLPVFLYQSSNV